MPYNQQCSTCSTLLALEPGMDGLGHPKPGIVTIDLGGITAQIDRANVQ